MGDGGKKGGAGRSRVGVGARPGLWDGVQNDDGYCTKGRYQEWFVEMWIWRWREVHCRIVMLVGPREIFREMFQRILSSGSWKLRRWRIPNP